MKVLAYNKKISKDYSIIERYPAGIVLFGYEVKSIKNSEVSIAESFVSVEEHDVSILHMYVPLFKGASKDLRYNPLRKRRLLLNKYEIKELFKSVHSNGLTVVPTKIFIQKNKIKVEIALVKGLKKYDKREVEKSKTANKEIEYALNRRKKGKI